MKDNDKPNFFFELILRLFLLAAIYAAFCLIPFMNGGMPALTLAFDKMGADILAGFIGFITAYIIIDWVKQIREKRQRKGMIKDIAFIKQRTLSGFELFNIINLQSNKVKKILIFCEKAKPFVSNYYTRLLRGYHNVFEVKDDGFVIKDEFLSLSAYVEFWQYLLEQQKYRIVQKEPSLKVRAVHSTTIDIWNNEKDKYQFYTEKLLNLQKEFISNKGTIVRIIIGIEKDANSEYQTVIQKMNSIGVKTYYLARDSKMKLNYDFLLLRFEKFVLKWYSLVNDPNISKAVMENHIEDEVEEKWAYLLGKLNLSRGDYDKFK